MMAISRLFYLVCRGINGIPNRCMGMHKKIGMRAMQHNTREHTQYDTTQHSTTQYNTIQLNTTYIILCRCHTKCTVVCIHTYIYTHVYTSKKRSSTSEKQQVHRERICSGPRHRQLPIPNIQYPGSKRTNVHASKILKKVRHSYRPAL
ncbi:hypothetical protein H4I96_10856 [Botrytis cinerea]